MGKRLIVLSERSRKKVAFFSEGRLQDLYVEEEGEAQVGNIYCGQVTKVLPSIPGAFVDYGEKRDGFLPLESMPIYEVTTKWRRVNVRRLPPREGLNEGQTALVQVVKEPIEDKGARLTTDVSLPGRYLVYMPIAKRGGISRQISSDSERSRLRNMVKEATQGTPGAFIIRTVCEGRSKRDIQNDCKALRRNWRNLCRDFARSDIPRLVYQELGLLERVLRDLLTSDFEMIVVNSKRVQRELKRILRGFGAKGEFDSKIKYRTGPQINQEYRIDRHFREALSRRVWLPCGGYLFIDELPTLTVIDVNTGKNVRRSKPQETILRTNLEAAREIPRQLRIRDIGGIIIIDFIDMLRKQDKNKVLQTLKTAMEEDRTAWDLIGYSEIGLVQITRKRDRRSLLYQLTEECPHCEGEGRIPKL